MLLNYKKNLCLITVIFMLLSIVPVGAAETAAVNTEFVLNNIDMPESDALFEGYVNSKFYPEGQLETNSHLGEDFLSENDKAVYEILKAAICEIAGGERESTVIDVGYEALASYGLKTKWNDSDYGEFRMSDSSKANAKEEFIGYFDLEKVLYALLEDCPYELYWFDKTAGFSCGIRTWTWTYTVGGTASVAFDLIFVFQTEKDYRPSAYSETSPTVNINKTSATTNAVNNAANIIYKYHEYEDYEKITAYKDEICGLTSYDHNAVSEDYTGGYGDPWQMIYVFDGDDTTNVVCEGYSKAFQYLMDNSVYESDKIECRSVQGTVYSESSGGAHMWNVVTLDDGLHYLADITNSDEGMVGNEGDLFLVGGKGNAKGGYTVTLNNGGKVKYNYDSSALKLWGEDESCPLTLFANQYIPHNLANLEFADKIGIQTTETDDETVLEITRRTEDELPEINVFSVVYGKDGKFKKSGHTRYSMKGKDKIKAKFSKSGNSSGETTRLFIWTENLMPVTEQE